MENVARTYAGKELKDMLEALKTWRFPYWDWAAKKPGGGSNGLMYNVPKVLNHLAVEIRVPAGTRRPRALPSKALKSCARRQRWRRARSGSGSETRSTSSQCLGALAWGVRSLGARQSRPRTGLWRFRRRPRTGLCLLGGRRSRSRITFRQVCPPTHLVQLSSSKR